MMQSIAERTPTKSLCHSPLQPGFPSSVVFPHPHIRLPFSVLPYLQCQIRTSQRLINLDMHHEQACGAVAKPSVAADVTFLTQLVPAPVRLLFLAAAQYIDPQLPRSTCCAEIKQSS